MEENVTEMNKLVVGKRKESCQRQSNMKEKERGREDLLKENRELSVVIV